MPNLQPQDIERFHLRFKPTDGCWEWISKGKSAYGCFCIGKKKYYAHRISYQIFIGFIPPGLDVCHHCDNPKCIRPSHLFLGTDLDNMRDRASKGRNGNMNGERGGRSKISDLDAIELRKLYGKYHYKTLQFVYGINRQNIWKVANRVTYKTAGELK